MNRSTPHSHPSRRRFLHTTSAAVALTALPRIDAAPGVVGENDHFYYRLAPEGPYIDSQRDNQAFGFDDQRVYLSEDNAKSWIRSLDFPDAKNVLFSAILKNSNILFGTRANLFLSTDRLRSYREIRVKRQDGSDYLPHKPLNPELPGWYFHPLDGVHTWQVDGREMLVWGNYCNVKGGAVPNNIYYSTDHGETVKLAYSFGQNPRFQEKGSKTLLGDPDNPVICRHIHAVAYNPAENAFYASTGDIDRGHGHECHWLRGEYNAKADTWNWKVLVSVNSNSRYKSGGINFVDGMVYWAADANGRVPAGEFHDRGIFRCHPKDIANPKKHEMLFNPLYESANMIIQDNTILSAHYAPASPYHCGFIISNDMGKSWAQYDLKQLGRRSALRFDRKNSDGWFRVDLRQGWIDRGEVLFIKPKT
ncbi:MAG: hypothetical protein ACPGVU_00500 [Limisphaerales bacterium]